VPRAVVFLLCALVLAGCGGGGNGDSDVSSEAVEAFPDVLEIARSELPESAPLLSVSVYPDSISFVHVELGRTTEIRYDLNAVFIGNRRIGKPSKIAKLFPIELVPADAPARMLSAIDKREDGDVEAFEATLQQDGPGKLSWRAKATVDGRPKRYRAALDGTLTNVGA
jgi:hypothetical protein